MGFWSAIGANSQVFRDCEKWCGGSSFSFSSDSESEISYGKTMFVL